MVWGCLNLELFFGQSLCFAFPAKLWTQNSGVTGGVFCLFLHCFLVVLLSFLRHLSGATMLVTLTKSMGWRIKWLSGTSLNFSWPSAFSIVPAS